ncbi:hypothetical protein NCCP2716_30020 [Sporosarcina sp. NCCP-2716]|uniref:hypothetical protein n=1 Tax=Sporosarcina sp. NCCP-2716 TaxID=2943679 RepID=UPI0020416E15|nr:hypothetical protein [Sporosarcina sp. NCCP-2716]GKV70504.1 hypothetical protein NCCP2716_30020 [Sporosarcina sp. NCCP-2716]
MKITPDPLAYKAGQTSTQKTANDQNSKGDALKKSEKAPGGQVDQYIPSQPETSIGYEKPTGKPDMSAIDRLKAESERVHENLMNIVRQLLERQGITMDEAVTGNKEIIVDEQARTEAQSAIGEGGPLSPEKLSDSIVEFANAISGGDKSKFDLLKGAIEDGFNEAKKALGGELPEISQKTYDLAMEKLEKWRDG